VGLISSRKSRFPVKAGTFFIIFTLAVFAAILPSCGKKDSREEVISKRVKLDLPDTPGEQQPKTDAKPAVGTMPDVKADLPVKEVVKPDTAKPAIKVEIPEKKEPEVVKDKVAPEPKVQAKVQEKDTRLAAAPGGEADKKPAVSETTEKSHTGKVKKRIYTKAAIKKAKQKPWAVNVASFPTEAEAKKLISALRASGYNGYRTEFTKSSMKWHRVRVGFYRTKKDALKASKRIEAKFHAGSAWAVQPGKEETLEHIR